MNKFLVATITAATLAGCTVNRTTVIAPSTTLPDPTTTVEVTIPEETFLTAPTTTVTYDDDEFYVEFVKDNTNLEWTYSDTEILTLGYGFCDMLDQGYSADAIFTAMAEIQITQGLSEDFMMDIAAAFGSAVPSFCPEYDWMLG